MQLERTHFEHLARASIYALRIWVVAAAYNIPVEDLKPRHVTPFGMSSPTLYKYKDEAAALQVLMGEVPPPCSETVDVPHPPIAPIERKTVVPRQVQLDDMDDMDEAELEALRDELQPRNIYETISLDELL